MESSLRSALTPLFKRTGQLLWLYERWADVEADALVFYHIDDIDNYPDAAKFFRLAFRLPAYRGALREHLMAEQMKDEPTSAGRLPNRSKIKSSGRKKGYRQVNNLGEQKALVHAAGGETVKVATTGSYLEEKLKRK